MANRPRIALPLPTCSDLEYNRQCLPPYVVAIEQSGGDAVQIPLDISDAELRFLMRECDGVVLPGSPADVDPAGYGQLAQEETAAADPAREQVDRSLLEDALAYGKPVLGICFGLQSANVWRGGTLLQNLAVLPVHHAAGAAVGVAHAALIDPSSALGSVVDGGEAPLSDARSRLPVNSSHHQAVGTPGDGLRITARCPQDGVVEALEADPSSLGMSLVAVQWHPERSFATSATSRGLFRWLVEGAARQAACRP